MGDVCVMAILLLWSAVVLAVGSAVGRHYMLKDLGLTWADYDARLGGRLPR